MLLELEIKDFALIDQINIQFKNGLNILTGETGAGKSIIIDAVNMVIGERADRNFVRSGSKKARIQAVFCTKDIENIYEILDYYGIEKDNENTLIITREIYANGRSICRINGVIISQKALKRITEKLIDIHGQHEHQSLLNTSFHIDLLDAYAGEEIQEKLNILSEEYKRYVNLQNKLNSLFYDDKERERNIDLLNYQINEIEAANLEKDEEEKLNEQRILLSNCERIYSILTTLYEDFYQSNMNPSILDIISKNVKALNSISNIDDNLLHFYNSLEEVQYIIEDLIREIRIYRDNIDFQPEALYNIEERLDVINDLKRKYGNTIEDILLYKDKTQKKLDNYINSKEEIEKMKDVIAQQKKELETLSWEIRELRIKAAKTFETKLIEILETLNMGKVLFSVNIELSKDDNGELKFSQKGIDKVEFMISTNVGEPVKSLSKIASGGEMSRIMLAFKTILAHVDNIPTLIFDEIDTGISGITAQVVGENLRKIGKNRQVICITHLPQIAAMANAHFLIEKEFKENTTKTFVKKLDQNSRLYELGRLLGGEITSITLEHADEMIKKFSSSYSK
ncbi:MAG: DNA repair protein RecN [Clostridiales bacterium]|nr:DNA repair protein RecN [Clostridiales bacterium]